MQPFVVVAHGRSGSSVLCKALTGLRGVTCHGEVFHDRLEDRWLIDGAPCPLDGDAYRLCAEVYRPRDDGQTHVGFKLLPHQAHTDAGQFGAWRYLREHRDVRIIVLERTNLFDAFISNQRSLQSGVWHVIDRDNATGMRFASHIADGRGIAYLGERAYLDSHNAPLQVDPEQFEAFATSTLVGMAWARNYLRTFDRECLEVRYEQMRNDFPGTLARIKQFLGVDDPTTPVQFHVLNQVDHRRGVANYAELRDRFRYTFLGCHFDD